MNEDYLWDKTGETDPEIKRLEILLGTMRYERRVVPIQLPTRRRFNMSLAAAAAVALMLLASGLWLAVHRTERKAATPQSDVAQNPTPAQNQKSEPTPSPQNQIAVNAPQKEESVENISTPRQTPPRPVRMRQVVYTSSARSNQPRLSREELREGELAKEQLMRALFITSGKLNYVQKKMQANKETGPAS